MKKKGVKAERKVVEVKERNPQDATFRNINALKKRVDRLEEIVEILKGRVIPFGEQ